MVGAGPGTFQIWALEGKRLSTLKLGSQLFTHDPDSSKVKELPCSRHSNPCMDYHGFGQFATSLCRPVASRWIFFARSGEGMLRVSGAT